MADFRELIFAADKIRNNFHQMPRLRVTACCETGGLC